MKKVLIIIFVLALISTGYFFLQNTKPQQISETSATQTTLSPTKSQTKTFVTSDKRIAIDYPKDWTVIDTTLKGSKGQFGPFVESWVIQSFPQDEPGRGGIPENSVKIDFEIMEGGGNLPLEALIDCKMKTITCERIGIGESLFLKAESTLNTGMKTVQVATFYDSNVFRGIAYVQTGEKQSANVAIAEKLLNSITFQNLPN